MSKPTIEEILEPKAEARPLDNPAGSINDEYATDRG